MDGAGGYHVTRRIHRLDEDDVRVRPGRGKSRPRSKERPAHATALPGSVMTVDRGRLTIELDDGTELFAVKAREIGRKGIVVGDRVEVVGDVSGETDTQARIVRRLERISTLRRTADDTDPVERVIVANATQLAVVTAAADPEPRTGLIDRALVAALDAGIRPMLIVTKTDLRSPDALLALYGPLDLDVIANGEMHNSASGSKSRSSRCSASIRGLRRPSSSPTTTAPRLA